MEKRLNILRVDGLQEHQEKQTFDRKVQQKIVFIVYGNHVEEIENAEEIQKTLTQKNYKSTLSSGNKPSEVFVTINDAIETSSYKVTVLVFPHLQTTLVLRKLIVYPLLENDMCRVIMVKISLLNKVPEYAKPLRTLDLAQDKLKWWPQLRKLIGRCAGEMRAVVARVHSSQQLKEFNNILDRLDLEISHASLENQMYARGLARKQLCVTKSTRLISKVKRKHQCHASNPILVRFRNETNISQQGKTRTQHAEIPTLEHTQENLPRACTENLPYGKDAHVFVIDGHTEEEKRLAKKMTTMLQLHGIICISRDELQTTEDLLQAMMTSVKRSVVTIILNFTKLSGISSIVADYAFHPDRFDKKAVVIPVIFSRKEQKEEKNLESSSPTKDMKDLMRPDKSPLEKRRERQLDLTTGQGVLMEDEDWQNKVLGYIQEVQRRQCLKIAPEQKHAEKCRIQHVVDDLQLVVKTPSYRAKKQLYLACLEKRPDLCRFLSSHNRCSVQSLPNSGSSSMLTDTGSDISIQSEKNIPMKTKAEGAEQTPRGRPSSQAEGAEQTPRGRPSAQAEGAEQTPRGRPSSQAEGAEQTPRRGPSSVPLSKNQNPEDNNHPKRYQTPEPYASRAPEPHATQPSRGSSSLLTASDINIHSEENEHMKTKAEGAEQTPRRRPSSVPLSKNQNPEDNNHPKRCQTPEPYASRAPEPQATQSSRK